MQEKIRQHYVPRTYLKNFATKNNEGKYILSFINAGELEKGNIKSASIDDLCVAKNIYTLDGKTSEQRMMIEEFYSDAYEKGYDSIYSKLVDERITEITDEDRRLIIGMTISLFYRNRSWSNFITNMFDDIFKRAIEMCDYSGHNSFIFEGKEINIDGKSAKQLSAEHWAREKSIAIIKLVQSTIQLLRLRLNSDGIHVSKIKNPNDNLLTSDRPVIVMDPDGGHIFPMNPRNFLLLPLDSKHMLALLPGCHSDYLREINRSDDGYIGTFANNLQQYKSATLHLFGKEDHLKSYSETVKRINS
jgi:hypothetical protein